MNSAPETSRPPPQPAAALPSAPLAAAAPPRRHAWIEIDLNQLRRNFELIQRDKPKSVGLTAVVKDEAYGHGALQVARVALDAGADSLAVVTLDEGWALRKNGVTAPILLLGEREEGELRFCFEHNLTCCISRLHTAARLSCLAVQSGKRIPVHIKIDTGMSRYGVRWERALPFLEKLAAIPGLKFEGILSHFAMSDELDKSFALLQLERFEHVLEGMRAKGISVHCRHLCNSGGFLDLPRAHFDKVRTGLLPLGVYPSKVCRRIGGLEPVMTIKAKIAAIQKIRTGDSVGYGLRYVADSPRRIAVLPLGYGDGFPRVRNQGDVLIHGRRAPLAGSVSMDAVTVDVTEIPEAQLWDEAVIMGRQGAEEISVHEIAQLKNSVSYDVLTGWRFRLPRVYQNSGDVL